MKKTTLRHVGQSMVKGSFILAKILGSWGIFSILRLVLYKQGGDSFREGRAY